jgi:hypothetical protein
MTTPATDVILALGRAHSVSRNVNDRARDTYSVFDSFTAAQIQAVRTNDSTVDVGTAIANALADLPFGGRLYFPAGTYTYATSPNFGASWRSIVGEGNGTIFNHTGSGNAFVVDGGTSSNLNGVTIEDIRVNGNSQSTNGIYIRGVARSYFKNMIGTGCATTGSGLLVEFGLTNTFHNIYVLPGEPTNAPVLVPLYGIRLATRNAGERSTANTFINPITEGFVDPAPGQSRLHVGFFLDDARANTLIGGTAENCDTGIKITGAGNVVISNHLENTASGAIDLYCTGAGNTFLHTVANSTVNVGVSGSLNTFVGGFIKNLLVHGATAGNSFNGVTIETLTDSSIATNWISCADASGNPIGNKLTGGLVVVGSLSRGLVTETAAARTVMPTDSTIIANRAGTVTLSLPWAGDHNGRLLQVRTVQAQAVVSAANNVVPLAGGAPGSAILTATAGKWATLQSDGANWQVIAGN